MKSSLLASLKAQQAQIPKKKTKRSTKPDLIKRMDGPVPLSESTKKMTTREMALEIDEIRGIIHNLSFKIDRLYTNFMPGLADIGPPFNDDVPF
jgi:hypothetical protein